MNKLLVFMNFCFVGALIVAIYFALSQPPADLLDIWMIIIAVFGLFVGNYIALRRRESSVSENSWRAPIELLYNQWQQDSSCK